MISAFDDYDESIPFKESIKPITIKLVKLLQDAINKPDFWKGRESEIRKLQGEIDDLLDFSNVEAISKAHARLSIELMSLAKRRHHELLHGL